MLFIQSRLAISACQPRLRVRGNAAHRGSSERATISPECALVAGGGVAFYIAAHVWDSPILGAVAFFNRACREVLDGTERLSSPLPGLEIGSRRPGPVPPFPRLRLAQGTRAGCFPHCLVDVCQDFGSPHGARIPHHDHGGVGSLPLRVFPLAES